MSLPTKQPTFRGESQGAVDAIRRLNPPGAVIHIGAGGGQGDMHEWHQWQVANALIIDADAERLSWVAHYGTAHPGWQSSSALLTDADGDVTYHQASNPEEDGLVPPESLASVWPNLRTVAQTQRSGTRLDNLLNQVGWRTTSSANKVWGIVECLPALPILRGAGVELERWSVLWLRVWLGPNADDNPEAALPAIEQFLTSLEFRCVHVQAGNHPAIGQALFVKDWQTALQTQIDTLGQTQDQQTQLAVQRKAELEALTKEKGKLTAARDASCNALAGWFRAGAR